MHKWVFISEDFVRDLKQRQRDLIVEHVDGTVAIIANDKTRWATRFTLIKMGLLRYNGRSMRPHSTELTEAGRQALGMILGWYADSLVKAGYGPDTFLDALKRLRTREVEVPAEIAPDPAPRPVS